jgi:hypothetical protein
VSHARAHLRAALHPLRLTMDLAFTGLTATFFLATWGFVRLCERLSP